MMLNFVIALMILLANPVSTSPFATLPYGTPLACYFEQDVNQLRCWLSPDLTYGVSWGALRKETDKGLFRLYATADRDLVTPLVGYYDGQPVTMWVVSPGDKLPGGR